MLTALTYMAVGAGLGLLGGAIGTAIGGGVTEAAEEVSSDSPTDDVDEHQHTGAVHIGANRLEGR